VVLEAVEEQKMTDQQFAAEIRDLVRRANAGAQEASRAGLEVIFEAHDQGAFVGTGCNRLSVVVRRPL